MCRFTKSILLQCEDSYVDFGNVLVGSSASQLFDICNEGNCAVQFLLSVEQKVEGQSAGLQATGCKYKTVTSCT